MPDVSVIIPTYNHARFIGQAIDSALAQTLTLREIIVVDDGSTDDTAQVLEQYGHRIRVIRQVNSGVATARNAGAAHATGDLLAFLDADDVWLPRKLALQVKQFSELPALGLNHCGLVEIDAMGRPGKQIVEGMEGKVAAEMLFFLRPVILGGGSGVVIPKKVFRAVGGFDATLSTSADWDLYFRIASRWQVGFVPEVLLQYRVHESNMHGNIDLMRRDMLRCYEKAFTNAEPDLLRLRRYSYARLHMVLAGSFFQAGQHLNFIRHACKSVLLSPRNASYLACYPLRSWQRRLASARPLPQTSEVTK